MALTPVEIRHAKLARSMFGYRRDDVDRLLEDVISSFEDVWRERADLTDRVEQLEAELGRYRDLEGLLRATLVTAERAASELREQAQREADLIVGEARTRARELSRNAADERDRLLAEARRIRAILRGALAAADEIESPVADVDAAPRAASLAG
jgi:cell division initiation protein